MASTNVTAMDDAVTALGIWHDAWSGGGVGAGQSRAPAWQASSRPAPSPGRMKRVSKLAS
jgi:hypothetical protein